MSENIKNSIENNIQKYIKAYNYNLISRKDLEQYASNCTMSYIDPAQCVSGGNINGYYGDNSYYPTTITTTDNTGSYPKYYPGAIGTNPGCYPGTTGPNPGYYHYYYPSTTTGDNYWIYTTGNGKFDVLNNKEMEDIEKLPEEIKMKITKDVEKAIKDKIKIEFDSQLKSMKETMDNLNMSIVNETTAINILKQEKILLEKQINDFKEQLGKILKDIEEASEKYAKRVMRFQLLDIKEDE